MYNLSEEKLKSMGASITTAEIKQQPDLWKEAYARYTEKKESIKNYLSEIESKHERIRVIFTGAGTSAYVGDTILPYLKEKGNEHKWDFLSIPTTTLVSNPYQFLKEDIPTILVSFARSGNSPESVASVELAKEIVTDFYQITITCAADGKLARSVAGDDKNLLLLMPEKSNDQGFAMTGSFTCMTLTALLVFDSLTDGEEQGLVDLISDMGESVVKREAEIQDMIDSPFNRIIYLGSGSLEGLTREAQLKVLELTAGKTATNFDSSLGFRHGPKSFVNEDTVAFVFISNNSYTRKYDMDMLNELRQDDTARRICAISVVGEANDQGDCFTFKQKAQHVPDAYLALPYVMFAQTISLLASVKVGNTPDTPSPTGTVNRVVKGVTIHEYQK
ncbi:Putative tagatose-6-phosphate ketose/aldose isomerase [Paraliobacillus sp. PM-2]|uniref:SIS domain-containing protein n=1 Tax=Paraliobacillus sp. PM-2 TaxID=1462524 RepID=UPI00061C586E|nr:SIS domain-containing protein [Paraliobacillus sp. PM-2]CQR46282.1 Putative tagatose-6-phosphate ketose/aldose isomerase [Paraliobacillus sp. PM-2]